MSRRTRSANRRKWLARDYGSATERADQVAFRARWLEANAHNSIFNYPWGFRGWYKYGACGCERCCQNSADVAAWTEAQKRFRARIQLGKGA